MNTVSTANTVPVDFQSVYRSVMILELLCLASRTPVSLEYDILKHMFFL